MVVLMVFLVLVVVVGAFAGDDCVRCSVGVIRRRVTVGGHGGLRMGIVRLVTLVFLCLDDLGRFMLFVLVLFCLFFVAMLSIVSLFVEMTVGMLIARVGMAVGVGITEIVRVYVLLGVSMVSRRSPVRMDYVHPRLTHVALKRVGPRFVAVGTVLTRLFILICAGKINDPTQRQANAAKAHEGALHVNAGPGLAFQDDLHG